MEFEFEYYMEHDGYASVHVHFNCPVCGMEGAGTDYLCEYFPHDENYAGEEFDCSNCDATFCTTIEGKIKLVEYI